MTELDTPPEEETQVAVSRDDLETMRRAMELARVALKYWIANQRNDNAMNPPDEAYSAFLALSEALRVCP